MVGRHLTHGEALSRFMDGKSVRCQFWDDGKFIWFRPEGMRVESGFMHPDSCIRTRIPYIGCGSIWNGRNLILHARNLDGKDFRFN